MTFIQIAQETGWVVWYSYLFKNFPQFVVIQIVKGFDVVNKAEVDVFLELSCFFNYPARVFCTVFPSNPPDNRYKADLQGMP